MRRSRLQLDADRRAAALRRTLAEDVRRMREDAGVSRAAIARLAGVDASVVSRLEAGSIAPTLETYARVAEALGADLAARVYPQTGPAVRDRHQVRMAELLLGSLDARWVVAPEVAVRRPVRGWVDLVLHDPGARTVVATELESTLRTIERLIRRSGEKATALPSASAWARWRDAGLEPRVSRLLVVRWTRANREVATAARRLLRDAYPADPRDALESLSGSAAWPGAAMLWSRLDGDRPRLLATRA